MTTTAVSSTCVPLDVWSPFRVQGSVFDDSTKTCVPANSYYDKCTRRMASKQHCPPGTQGLVPHPDKCAQYFDCGASHASNRLGWDSQMRECPYPYVFSPVEKRCVQSTPGLCGNREEPLDQCDYKENQCEGHSGCVPCHVRFPTCRGRQDGLNAWYGRQGSPYYVTCLQQRVVSTAMCEQNGFVAIFDEGRRECVKKEEGEKPEIPVPQTIPKNQGYIPQQQQSYQLLGYLGYQNNHAQGTAYQQGYGPQVPATHNQYQNTNNQYQNTNNQNTNGQYQSVYNPYQKPQQTHVQYVWV